MTIDANPDPSASSFAVPLLWEVTRATERGRVDDPAGWAAEVLRDVPLGSVMADFASYIDRSDNPVDLSQRIELPDDDEAHFIDTDSDLFRALALVLVLRPNVQDPQLTSLGGALRHRFDAFETVVEAMKGHPVWSTIGATGVEALDAAISRVRDAVRQGREQEAEQIAALAVDASLLDQFRTATQRVADSLFPRDLIRQIGAIRYVRRGPVREHTLRITMPRSMVVANAAVADAAELGDQAGRVVATYEDRLLRSSLGSLRRRTFGVREVDRRVTAAISDLEEAGLKPRLLLLPFDWRAIQRLTDSGLLSRDARVGVDFLGRIGSLDVRQQATTDADGYLFAEGEPVELRVRGSHTRWLEVTVRALGVEDTGFDEANPKVEVAVLERAQLSLDRSLIRRIAL